MKLLLIVLFITKGYSIGVKTTINARKFDRQINRSWECELIEETGSLLLFVGEFSEEVVHSKLGVIKRGTFSYEYYWLDRMYNVFRFHEPDGTLRNFYSNINLPPIFENGVLDYVDLDIDILVWKDFSFEILDLDEFEENSKKFGYSAKLINEINQTLEELKIIINDRKFPFDYN